MDSVIGLWLAKGVVEKHGGSIEVKSDGPGKGSEFRVRLPMLAEVPAPPPVRAEFPDSPERATTRRILAADDNSHVVESLALLLRLMGHEVETAGDGLEAVEAAARYRPDVVLLDIGMPKLDGYAACRRIRAEPWGESMVIMAVTGWGQDDDRRKSKAAGFNGHLVKPVQLAALQHLLADLSAFKT